MINSEDDVRAWVREASGGKARWVEPALGSTPGLPDCWVPLEVSHDDFWQTAQVHLELKCGVITRNVLRYSLRPEQRREIIAMKDHGVAVGLCVGIKRTNSVFFLRPSPGALQGNFSMFNAELALDRLHGNIRDDKEFWRGVNFIFLNSV